MAKCVGCGYCCLKAPCGVAVRLYGNGLSKCPQLKWDGERYFCGLMRLPEPLGKQYRKELYAGEGCCCGLNSWRNDVRERDNEEKSTPENPLPPVFQIFLKCLSKQFISGDVMSLTLYAMTNELRNNGYENPELIAETIYHTFKENRSSFNSGFMG